MRRKNDHAFLPARYAMLQRQVLLLLCICFICCKAFAQTGERSVSIKNNSTRKGQVGNTYAIIIGVNHYDNIDSLRFARNDAEAFYKLLVSPVFKVPKDNVFLFLDQAATRSSILSAFYALLKKVSPNDQLIFYFAGHGDVESTILQDNSLLLLPKTPKDNYLVDGDYIEMDMLNKLLENLRGQKKVSSFLICDACHSGKLIGGVSGQNATATSFKENLKSDVKILSCQPNELSEESTQWGNGRGVFSYYLELALKGIADDGDGVVTLEEIEAFIKKEVSGSTLRKQHPYVFGSPVTEVCAIDKSIMEEARKCYANKSLSTDTYASVKGRGVGNSDIYYNRIDALFARPMPIDILVDSADHLATEFMGNASAKKSFPYLEQKLYDCLINQFNKWTEDIYEGKKDIMTLPYFKEYVRGIQKARSIIQNPFLLDDVFARYSFCEAQLNLSARSPRQTLLASYDSLRKAQALMPAAAFLYKQKAEVLFALGRNAESLAQLDTLIRLLPNYHRAFNLAGLISYRMKNYEQSLKYFATATKMKPDFYDAYYNMGVVLKEMNRGAEANFYFQKALNKKQDTEKAEY